MGTVDPLTINAGMSWKANQTLKATGRPSLTNDGKLG